MQGQTRHTLVAEEGSRLQSQQYVSLSLHCSILFHVIVHSHTCSKGLLACIAAAGCVSCLTIDTIDACYVALIVVKDSHPTKVLLIFCLLVPGACCKYVLLQLCSSFRVRCIFQVHHTVAGIISDDAKLLQCARVITWLEELASQSLDYTTEQGQGCHLQGLCCEPHVNAVNPI